MAAQGRCLALALAVLLTAALRTAAQAAVPATTPRPPTVAAIALSIRSRAIQDSRCYLMNGGAVESFFVSEDTPVGSVIGTLSVNGDPSDTDGNISLKLQEKNAAIGIVPGSKNITLLRPLDREEKQGPSNVYVNVRCDRRRTTDPSFIIPVSVRVWDVNDNAPVWLGAPYRVRLSELTAVGSRVLPAARATDADQPGPHATIHYSVLPGPHSEYFGFANELDSVLVVKKPLDFETLNNFTLVLRASDQGVPPLYNDTTLRVEVLDADDQNPRFTHDHYSATLPDDAQEGTILETQPGPVSAVDRDVGINAPLHYSLTGERRDLVAVDRDTGRVAVTRRLLEAGDLPATVVIKATQVDNADRYALATLWLGRGAGAAPARVRFARRSFAARAREDAAPGAVLATLLTEPQGAGPLQFYVSDRSFLDKFAINSAGEVLLRKPLDFETADSYHYQVMVTDGITNDTASLNISVLNVNEWEPRFRYPQYEFRVEETAGGEGLLRVGKLDVHDGDKPDSVSLTLRGSDAGMFYINDSGEMFMRQEALQTLNSSVLHVVATAVDSGAPPRQTSVPVLVHVSERLLSQAGPGSARGALLAAFAGALALLALLVVVLLAYIFRNKRRSKSPPTPSPPSKATGFVPHEPPRSPPALTGTVAPTSGLGASSGSLLSVSAGASTILANSSSSLDLRGDTLPNNGNGSRSATSGRQSQRFPTKTKVAPAPPPVTDASPAAPPAALALMSDHLRASAASRSGVAWPSTTIPARVKKLSWDDADHPHDDDAKLAGRPTRPGAPRSGPIHQSTFTGQPAATGRHQPDAARPPQPHRLLLSPAAPIPRNLIRRISPPQNKHLPSDHSHEVAHSINNLRQFSSPYKESYLPQSGDQNLCLSPRKPLDFSLESALMSGPSRGNRSVSNVQDAIQSAMPSLSYPQAFNLNITTTCPPPMTSFPSQHLPNMTQVITNHPLSVSNYTYALPVPPRGTSQTINMNMDRTLKKYPKLTPKKLKSKIILSPRYLITNVHHPLMSTNDPVVSTRQPSMNPPHPKPTPPHPSSHSHPSLPLRLPATAPRLSQVDPIAAALSRPKGPPPEYATIDPRKLRTRHLRPIFFRKGAKEKPLSNNSSKNTKLSEKSWRLKV